MKLVLVVVKKEMNVLAKKNALVDVKRDKIAHVTTTVHVSNKLSSKTKKQIVKICFLYDIIIMD